MHETNIKLLNMVKEGKTANEMSAELGLSNKQLFRRIAWLRNIGIDLQRIYYQNGNISYYTKRPTISLYNNKVIYTNPNLNGNQIIKTIAVSDLHYGHEYNIGNYMYDVYDFCAKNGIHIIFNSGDLFEGLLYNNSNDEYPIEQITRELNNYPFDKNIINFTVLGNHDYDFTNYFGTNLMDILYDRRHDIVPVGYGYGKVDINNLDINLFHTINYLYQKAPYLCPTLNSGIILQGHTHRFKIVEPNSSIKSNGCLLVMVPSLSDVTSTEINGESLIPSFLEMDINFTNYNPVSITISSYSMIHNKIYRTGEFYYSIKNINCEPGKKLNFVNYKYLDEELDRKDNEEEVAIVEQQEEIVGEDTEDTEVKLSLSQIEKFNQRYKL